jgi:hypothetical protein
MNLYAYVCNDPLNNDDLYGLEALKYMPAWDSNNSFYQNMQNVDVAISQGIIKWGGDLLIGMAMQLGHSNNWEMQIKTLDIIKNKKFVPFSTQVSNGLNLFSHKYMSFDQSNINLISLRDRTPMFCSLITFTWSGSFLVDKVLNKFGMAISKESFAVQSLGNKAWSGIDLLGKTKNITVSQLKKMSEAGKVLDRGGLTKAGRGLAKHGGRQDSVFPKPIGSPKQINKQGQKILNEILNHPERQTIYRDHKVFGSVIDIKVPRLGGVRFSSDQSIMHGFLEP